MHTLGYARFYNPLIVLIEATSAYRSETLRVIGAWLFLEFVYSSNSHTNLPAAQPTITWIYKKFWLKSIIVSTLITWESRLQWTFVYSVKNTVSGALFHPKRVIHDTKNRMFDLGGLLCLILRIKVHLLHLDRPILYFSGQNLVKTPAWQRKASTIYGLTWHIFHFISFG